MKSSFTNHKAKGAKSAGTKPSYANPRSKGTSSAKRNQEAAIPAAVANTKYRGC